MVERSAKVGPAHVALVVVQFCFGLFPVYAIRSTQPGGFDPRAIAALRIVFGALSLSACALAVHGRSFLPARALLPRLAVCSVLGVLLNQVLYLQGVPRSTASQAGVVMCLIPVLTFAVAAVVRQERFEPARALGIVLALAGAAWWLFFEDPAAVLRHGTGNLLMAANAASYAVYLVLQKPLLRRVEPLVVIAWVYLLAVPFVPLLLHDVSLAPAVPTPRLWTALAFVLLFPTFLAYLLNTWALSRVRASTTAVYIYLQALISAAGGMLMENERPSPALLGAAVLVFLGIALVARRRHPTVDAHG